MSLQMKTECEICKTPTPAGGEAFICSHECTFCASCTENRAGVCPNCNGELVARPRRS